MKRVRVLGSVVALAVSVAACKGSTAPSRTPIPPSQTRPGELFAVSGTVTDDLGAPLAGASVTMRYQVSGSFGNSAVVTNAGGRYSVEFTSNPWNSSEGRGAARAEIVADGYDWFWRTVWATGPHLVEDFRLQRIKQIAPGGSVAVSVTREHGDCQGWLYNPCGRLRVSSPDIGTLTLDAKVIAGDPDSPTLEVCCYQGDDVYGNPVSLHVKAGSEMWVEIGQNHTNTVTNQSVLVRASFQP